MNRPVNCNLCRELPSSANLVEEGVAAVASVGALTAGHMLVCPLVHSRSVASLPLAHSGRLLSAVTRLAEMLSMRLDAPVHVFEHGNARDGRRVACSVEHAHMHMLPADVDLSAHLAGIGRWQGVGWDPADLATAANGREYLLYRDPTGVTRIWITDSEPIPSQLMRRLISDALERPEDWNWRETPAVDTTAVTRRLLSDFRVRMPLLNG